jgi:hypothetical protein
MLILENGRQHNIGQTNGGMAMMNTLRIRMELISKRCSLLKNYIPAQGDEDRLCMVCN